MADTKTSYEFVNFFHPFVGELISKLNAEGLSGMMDTSWQQSLKWLSLEPPPQWLSLEPPPLAKLFDDDLWEVTWNSSLQENQGQSNYFQNLYSPTENDVVHVDYDPKELDVSDHGSYANYNWELFFHIPLTVAVHLSKNQRFAEAQRWFHYIFDPTCNDQSEDPLIRFWKFLAFRQDHGPNQIDSLLKLLSEDPSKLTSDDLKRRQDTLDGYNAVSGDEPWEKPFRPHAVARTRPSAYQYSVVMKYLDNLIAWGDSLFQQDAMESINEATQIYVLAANILGPPPQRVPPRGTTRAMTFDELKKNAQGGSDPMGDAMAELEGQFPWKLGPPRSVGNINGALSIFGMVHTFYFTIPRNPKLMSYWDTVADRLFKIRHCMNIEGVVRPLALFDPPIDPGMLVKAAAAGIDIGSVVSGLNQPIGPVRALPLIQKALEICNEVRSLGGALLSALEKGDAEHLALIRQRHEIQIQQLTQDVRFLQWKSAQESTKSLLTSRKTALERLHYYQRLLGLPADPNAPDTLVLEDCELTEDNFDEAYGALVGQYGKELTLQSFPKLNIVGDTSPAQQSGASGAGQLFLNHNEDVELNSHLPTARDTREAASTAIAIAGVLTLIPDLDVNLEFMGLGASSEVFGGNKLSDLTKVGASVLEIVAGHEQDQAGMASRTASYQRRADDWMLQYNLGARELMQIGRQILTSKIAEQIAHHEYLSVKQQIANAQEINDFLSETKFTNEDLYLWMQGEVSRLYYEYYRFAFDTARKAERTMKQELMRPELDSQDFVKFNYWDGGRKGLLSGEALHLDVKRMEMAYHDNNKRELELTRHVSLRQLDPIALLTLKATGTCTVTVPEWLYDMDCPGHYMRRIKSVGLSIPCVTGPYTSVNCTLSLLKSRLRTSSVAGDDYEWQGPEDDRFVDYTGTIQSVVTSNANNDNGLFETNLHDERFLPFEGAGAESNWKLDLPWKPGLPNNYPAFDYGTISDVILHIRYTARQGVDPTKVQVALEDIVHPPSNGTASPTPHADLALLFSLPHDFPTEWAVSKNGGSSFSASISKDYFPYFTQSGDITIQSLDFYSADLKTHDKKKVGTGLTNGSFTLPAPPDPREVFLVVRYSI